MDKLGINETPRGYKVVVFQFGRIWRSYFTSLKAAESFLDFATS